VVVAKGKLPVRVRGHDERSGRVAWRLDWRRALRTTRQEEWHDQQQREGEWTSVVIAGHEHLEVEVLEHCALLSTRRAPAEAECLWPARNFLETLGTTYREWCNLVSPVVLHHPRRTSAPSATTTVT
jgi:hypothetical protein